MTVGTYELREKREYRQVPVATHMSEVQLRLDGELIEDVAVG